MTRLMPKVMLGKILKMMMKSNLKAICLKTRASLLRNVGKKSFQGLSRITTTWRVKT